LPLNDSMKALSVEAIILHCCGAHSSSGVGHSLHAQSAAADDHFRSCSKS
jgi:hypothetical protein